MNKYGTVVLRQELINRLIQLNKKKNFLLSSDTSTVDWSNMKHQIQQNLYKIKRTAIVYEIVAYVLLTIIAVVAAIKLFSHNGGSDLNKGTLIIFLIVSNIFSVLLQKIRIERLEKQILLLDILEKLNVEK